MTKSKLIISGSSFLIPENKAWAELAKLHNLEFTDYGGWSRVLLEDSGEDAVIVIFLDDFLGNRELSRNEAINVFSSFIDLLENNLENSDGFLIVAFSCFQESNLIRYSRSINEMSHIYYWFKCKLEELCKKFNQLYCVDLDHEFSLIGHNNVFDSRNWYFAHSRLSNNGVKILADSIYRIVEKRKNIPSKVLVLDCDNTIWGGVIGEEGLGGILLGQDGLGSAFEDFQLAAKEISKEGVLLTLASKNNEEDVWNVFDNHQSMVFKRKDIVAWKINWEEKSKNIQELASELDLGLNSFVFWDDNPMERDKVKITLPEVFTIDVSKNVFDWPDQLRNLDCFAKFEVTSDDLKKTDQYRSRASFIQDNTKAVDELSYLKSIHLKPSLSGCS